MRILTGLSLILLSMFSITSALPFKPQVQSELRADDAGSTHSNSNGSLAQTVGSNPVPDLSLPKTVLSSVDSLIGAGGVFEASPLNITLYNRGIVMRLIADNHPHDEMILKDVQANQPSLRWSVTVQIGSRAVPLEPVSSNLKILGTNVTGTYVIRTERVVYGNHSGKLKVVYGALSSGPLKWDLEFVPDVDGHYEFAYDWQTSNSSRLDSSSKHFVANYEDQNYTFSWSDVPASFSITPTVSSSNFTLAIDLGNLTSGSRVNIDPSMVSTSGSVDATGYSFQRKIFYDSKAGRYWVFYVDQYAIRYSNSPDGLNWLSPQVYASCTTCNSADLAVSIYNIGEQVLVARGSFCSGSVGAGLGCTVSLSYSIGSVNGPGISWGPTQVNSWTEKCPSGFCSITLELRYISAIIASDGYAVFSANLYIQTTGFNGGICNPSWSQESDVLVLYKGQQFFADCENTFSSLRSILLSSDSTGGVRLIYQSHVGTNVQLRSRLFYGARQDKVVNPNQNAYIDKSNPNQNYNTSPFLVSYSDSSHQRITLLEFPLRSPPPDSLLSATLKLPLTSVSGTVSGNNCGCWILAQSINSPQYGGPSWSSTNATWTNFFSGSFYPLQPSGQTSSPLVSTYDTATSFDITGIVNQWYGFGDNGLGLLDPYANNWTIQVDLSSQLTYTFYCCMTQYDTVDTNTRDGNGFSGATDSNNYIHLLYSGSDGNVTYAYRNGSSPWGYNASILSNISSNPTLTIDLSTNYLYAFAFQGATLAMKVKSPLHRWADSSIMFPIINRNNPADLNSNFASASTSNSTNILLSWTERSYAPFNVTFASIPIQTVWSPYGIGPDPWDGNGVSPYGRYFSNLQEYVSPSSGMVTVTQTDLNVPGSGLSLTIARVYTEPQNFLNGAYNFENYPWAPVGNGWQLNFPWMTNTNNPSFIHLWNGDGYRIPATFWSSSPSFLNDVGEHFQMNRNSTDIYLYASSGTVYVFDQASPHRLLRIVDATSSNVIQFKYYPNNLIANITDTVSRNFEFCYDGNFLKSINQTTSGNCNSSTGSIRGIVFKQNGNGSLVTVWDPAGRNTTYTYSAVTNGQDAKWLISRITYPTGWYTNYTYTPLSLGATEGMMYRAQLQIVSSMSTPIREVNFTYTPNPGAQVTQAIITAYNSTFAGGSWHLNPVSITAYNFSFAGITWTVYDSAHRTLSGDQQTFDTHGDVTKDVKIVSDGGSPPNLGSYTNFYEYDEHGNIIYSRRVINPSAGWSHETFDAYYNDALPTGFRAFQETFSQNQGTSSDNPWKTMNGTWTVNNGVFNGTYLNGDLLGTFAYSDFGRMDLSIQARIFLARQINSSAYVGIFDHYPGSGTDKWSLSLENTRVTGYSNFTSVVLQDDKQSNAGSGIVSCLAVPVLGIWYTFNLTTRGNQANGWVRPDGRSSTCSVQTYFTSAGAVTQGTGFGLFAGGFSALFDNVTVSTVTSLITSNGFSSSFVPSGAPGSGIHGAVAGMAEFQNASSGAPVETYYSYYPAGELNQTRQRYNAPSGAVQWLKTTRSYDASGNLLSVVDPRGNTTSYGYSNTYGSAYLTSKTQTLIPGLVQITSSYGYDTKTGALTWSFDPIGSNTTYKYDILGRITKVTYPNGLGYIAYTYNDALNYVEVNNENGWKTRQVYDGLGRLSTLETFNNGAWYSNQTSTHDWQDHVTSTTDPAHHTTAYRYDALGRLVVTTKPDGNSTSLSYNDSASYVVSTDEYGNHGCSVYDRLGRMISKLEYSDTSCNPQLLNKYSYVTNYYYDEVGNLVRVTTSAVQSTGYTYDNLNRLTLTTYPDKTFENYTYDNNGNLVSKVDRNRVQTNYSFDSLNRITTINYRGSTPTSDTYAFDKNGNLLQLQNQNSTLRYGYDARNRLVNESYYVNNVPSGGLPGGGCSPVPASRISPSGTPKPCSPGPAPASGSFSPQSTPSGTVNATYTVSYVYNGDALSRIGYPGNLFINYTYDSLGRVTRVFQPSTNSTYATFSYYSSDQVQSITFGNGLISNYTYDRLSRPSTISVATGTGSKATTLLSLAYQYNRTGTVASVSGSVNSVSISEQYRYDLLQRLTNATLVTGSGHNAVTTPLWYQYDSAGNRVQESSPIAYQVLWNYTYNPSNNELSKTTYRYCTTTCYWPVYRNDTYDANGNLLSQTIQGSQKWTFSWNTPGQLLSVANNTGVQGYYAYDGRGRMVESKESSTTLFFAYSGTETLWQGNPWTTGNTGSSFVFANGLRIVKIVQGTTPSNYYYSSDALGSTRLVTDSSKNVIFSNNYRPFGQDNGTPTGSETYKFIGKPLSQTTGLYYEYSRWYDPSIGRFISEDPLAGFLTDPQSLNGYTYGSNSPTTVVDPTGLSGQFVNYRKPCPGMFQNFLGWMGCTMNSIAIGPDLVIDPASFDEGLNWLTSELGDRGPTVTTCDNCTPPPDPTTSPITGSSTSAITTSADRVSVGSATSVEATDVQLRDISAGGFEEARGEGIYGNEPLRIARGHYAEDLIKPELQDQGFNTQDPIFGRLRPDAWREGEIVEIKPFHEGINPFQEYRGQISSYIDAYRVRFPMGPDPVVRFILYRFI